MNVSSKMWLLIFTGLVLIASYSAMFSMPAAIVIIRFLALGGFMLLCVSLIIGPLVVIWPAQYAQLIEPRRAVGITAFLFILAHYILVIALEYDFATVFSSLPLLLAVPALLVFFALAITSTDYAVHALGNVNWKNLHRLAYPAFVLAFSHFILKSNGLFISIAGGKLFLNLAEASMVLLGTVTVLFQLYGFYLKRKRLSLAATQVKSPQPPALEPKGEQ